MLHLITESPYLALFSRMLKMFLRIYPTSLGAGGFVVIKFLVPTMFCCVELSLPSAVMFPLVRIRKNFCMDIMLSLMLVVTSDKLIFNILEFETVIIVEPLRQGLAKKKKSWKYSVY